MELVIPNAGGVDPLIVAAQTYRSECAVVRREVDPEGFALKPELATTDSAAQGLLNEAIRRNDGLPDEAMEAFVHCLAIVVAQQPDAVMAIQMIQYRLAEVTLALRREMQANGEAAQQGEQA